MLTIDEQMNLKSWNEVNANSCSDNDQIRLISMPAFLRLD